MGQTTGIEWTDHTFNPWRGCTKVSPGCEHCYAERESKRRGGLFGVWGKDGARVVASEAMWKQPLKWARIWRGKPRRGRVFCASLADWLEDRPELEEPRERLLGIITRTASDLEWLLLTKRPANGPKLLRLPRVDVPWDKLNNRIAIAALRESRARLGVSVESHDYVSRISTLLEWWHGPNFVSFEPLLGPINLRVKDDELGAKWNLAEMIHWGIAGGESGPGRRELDLDAIESLYGQCKAAGVPIFIKQDSGPKSGMRGRLNDRLWGAKEFPKEQP